MPHDQVCDSRPECGREGVLYAVGHSKNGILMGPLTAEASQISPLSGNGARPVGVLSWPVRIEIDRVTGYFRLASYTLVVVAETRV